MKELGFPDEAAAAFRENAITGGDTLQLGDEELSGDLGLSRLQVLESMQPPAPLLNGNALSLLSCVGKGADHLRPLRIATWCSVQQPRVS